jgi:trimethylamine-N-oxide reductase cytochrome c-type subunit TorC
MAVALQAASYIYVQEGIELPLKKQDIVLYNGDPVKVISKNDKTVKVKIEGYVDTKDRHLLYATKNFKLLLAKVKNIKSIKVDDDKGVLEVNIPKSALTEDMDEAWATGSDLFYDKCTKCHHAKIIEHHSMLTWGALFDSMKLKARTTKKQNQEILRFLRAFAKDGILRESD